MAVPIRPVAVPSRRLAVWILLTGWGSIKDPPFLAATFADLIPGMNYKRTMNGILRRRFDILSDTHMEVATRKFKADTFRQMHGRPRPLLLPNIWDVASARIVEEAGFEAVATSSAGIAFSLGYPDGQRISREEMLAAVARIAGAVQVPVTADMEAAYGDRPEDVARTVSGLISTGAVGMNLEDSRDDPVRPLIDLSLAVEKIRAARETAAAEGVPLVVNARTDVFLAEVGVPERRYDETIKRLAAFRDAGADCLFAPGVRDEPTIRRLVSDLKWPLNILAGPGSPTVPELQTMGVARISLGSAVMRATLGLLKRITAELSTSGTYKLMEAGPSFAEMNRMLGI